MDGERRSIRHKMEEKQARSNALAKEIGTLFKSGKGNEANELKKETGLLKQDIKDLSEALHSLEEKEHNLLLTLPNVSHPSKSERTGQRGGKPKRRYSYFASKRKTSLGLSIRI